MNGHFLIVVLALLALASGGEAQVRAGRIRVYEEVMRSFRLKRVDAVYPAASVANPHLESKTPGEYLPSDKLRQLFASNAPLKLNRERKDA